MRKILALATIVAFSLPVFAFAAFNDVTLTTDAVISVGGYTLNVSGSSAVIQSIVVNSSNLSVILASGSSLTVVSPTLNQLSSDVTSDVTNNTCTGSASSISLAYSGAGTVTNVITPSATICTTSSSGGGGGGGNGAPGLIGITNTNPTSASSVIKAPTTPPASTSPAAGAAPTFVKEFGVGASNADVMRLQAYLNAHGFTVASSGAGSPHHETNLFGAKTRAALVKFQKRVGISPATGYFGPKTRSYINAHS